MSKIHKGDEVIVNTGKDKGKRGTVLRTLDSGHVVLKALMLLKNMPSQIQ
jgi:large subunit ribosomal protein L24